MASPPRSSRVRAPYTPLAFALGILLGACVPGVNAQEKREEAKDRSRERPKMYHDQECSVTMREPKDWEKVSADGYAVPGEARAVWKAADDSSIVLFVQKPGQPVTPRAVLDASESAMKAAGYAIKAAEVRDAGPMRAMWLEVAGKGTGAALTTAGDVPTAQIWLAVPRDRDIVVLLLTAPQKDLVEHRKEFESVARSLIISGSQTREQQDSK
ncbi:MAG: hypothetical protein AB7Q17_17740 [Phycisphaerae bacterium]